MLRTSLKSRTLPLGPTPFSLKFAKEATEIGSDERSVGRD